MNKLFMKSILIWFFLLIPACSMAAERLLPFRTDQPPVIDGKLDDPVWAQAPSLSGFRTFIPDFGKDLSERTRVMMAYDAENLCFAFRCHDRYPRQNQGDPGGQGQDLQ